MQMRRQDLDNRFSPSCIYPFSTLLFMYSVILHSRREPGGVLDIHSEDLGLNPSSAIYLSFEHEQATLLRPRFHLQNKDKNINLRRYK